MNKMSPPRRRLPARGAKGKVSLDGTVPANTWYSFCLQGVLRGTRDLLTKAAVRVYVSA